MTEVYIGAKVRIYGYDAEGPYWHEGRAVGIAKDVVTVDFPDWEEAFKVAHLKVDYIDYLEVFLPTRRGTITKDFRT